MYSDCRGRLQPKGSFGFVAKCRENRASRMGFFSHRDIQFTTCLQELARGHHLIYSRYITINLRLKYV